MNTDSVLPYAIGFLVIGFVVLIYAGDCLVRGALAASLKANISPLLVGILIVGFGTSLPEFMIGIGAASAGNPGVAHGNIIGSNIANIFLVLALPAIIFPITTDAPRMKLTAVFMLLCTIAWVGASLTIGLTAPVGMAFLGVLVVYAIVAWMINRTDTSEDTPDEKRIMRMPMWRLVMLVLIGAIGLPLGAQILLESVKTISKEMNVDGNVISLTLVALGTSLPELGAGIAAAVRKQSDVAMGNILGANIFNVLGVGGAVAVLGPTEKIGVNYVGYANWVMLLAAVLITLVVLVQRRVGALIGSVFLVFYVVYAFGVTQNWSWNSLLVQPEPGAVSAPATPPQRIGPPS